MNKNVVIVLAGGFLVAILVAVLVQASLGGKKQVEGAEPRTQVLVASKNLPLGKQLAPGDLKWQTWPGNGFSGAIIRKNDQKPEEALTGRLIERVNEGQPLLTGYIAREGRGNVVAATLEKGMRAIAIPVKAFTMAGGFVTPGDYVDVILTYRVSVNRNEQTPEVAAYMRRHVSETILKNIRVLAVDQEASTDKDSAKIAKTVTLAVRADEAERLALAAEMGDLTLALRGLGDTDDVHEEAVTTDVGISRAMQTIVRMQGGGRGAGTAKIYNGASVSETRVYEPGDVEVVDDGYEDLGNLEGVDEIIDAVQSLQEEIE
ncbi:MAG: Flp pilus assembly protein CpaB [Micavibrio sp.]